MPGQDQTLCIEPCGGEARRKLRRATRRNTETEEDAEQTLESFSLSVGFEPVKEKSWFELLNEKESQVGMIVLAWVGVYCSGFENRDNSAPF